MARNADMDYNRADLGTLSNYQDITAQHMHFDWTIDFDTKRLFGSITLKMVMNRDGVQFIDLDTNKLKISAVSIGGTSCNFKVADAHKALGNKLSMSCPEALRKKDEVVEVVITYVATSAASAMQWLEPSLTKGGVRPYLFTQCQAIHARSMFPCQDTPGVKTSYSAVVRAPEWCTVLMSALADDSVVPEAQRGQKGVCGWNQPMPTCAYLVAVAAGDLKSKDISPRVRVWSEPAMVDAVAFEFSETEEFLAAAEGLTCPYQWGRYDVLCLPPSFPYGGMENPCLTFATPTLLAGDKSLADVIAHEIAHSWTGNLVTNATWEHFWLNEGWTVWLERKIAARMRGSDEFRKLSATSGWKTLIDSVDGMGAEHPFTRLVRGPSDEDPDDAFSSIPYEKVRHHIHIAVDIAVVVRYGTGSPSAGDGTIMKTKP
jgi:leukotriene-A4 hydrolase